MLLLVNDPAVLKQVCCIERYLKHYKILLIFEINYYNTNNVFTIKFPPSAPRV